MSNHIIIILGVFTLLLIWLLYGFRSLGELPINSPKTYLKNKRDDGKEIVVLIGDSLTHGNVQPSWVNSMRKKMGEKKIGDKKIGEKKDGREKERKRKT